MTTFHAPWSILTLRVQVGVATRTVEFDALSTGGSRFSTADKDIIAALRKHPRFGDEFNCVRVPSEVSVQSELASSELTTGEQMPSSPEEETAELSPGEEEEVAENAEGGDSESLEFTSPTDAANFLFEKYGIAKTKLKTKKAILAEASLLHLSITLE